jgi:hypothetical protein
MESVAVRRVLAGPRSGSSWPVMVETDGGRFLAKLRGAGHGTGALAAEVVVAELATALGLRVPPRTLLVLEGDVPSDDPDQELRDLLRASAGLNLGFTMVPRARDFQPGDLERVPRDEASTVAWLDGLVMNPDRTARNPNLLVRGSELWLIDHGAALGFQHDWRQVTEDAPRRPGPPLERHVLAPRATRLREWDPVLAALLTRERLRAALAAVPDDFLLPLLRTPGRTALTRRREAYVAFLWKRLRAPRPFVAA